MTPLIDSFGRIATDLRVSLTDRCNLRCTYCMPAEGLEWLRSETLLTTDEYIRLIGIAVTRLGIDSVRFTGGEPLIFKDLEKLVAAVAGLSPRPDIAVTTTASDSTVRRLRCERPDWTASTSRWIPWTPIVLPRSPGGIGCPTCCWA
ncbi:Putative molybdenum cofactor biosynthesis protein A2 [Mycobacteroides abscessus]|nr:Putative molybdenum cofactor biosynthesis protein A2 [Mycobacteroides abscessus]